MSSRALLAVAALLGAGAQSQFMPSATSEYGIQLLQSARTQLLDTGDCHAALVTRCGESFIITEETHIGKAGTSRAFDASGKHVGSNTYTCRGDNKTGFWPECDEEKSVSVCVFAERSLDVVAVTLHGQSRERFESSGRQLASDLMSSVVSFSRNPFDDVRVSVSKIDPKLTLAVERSGAPASPLMVGSEFSLPAVLVVNGEGRRERIDVRKHYAPRIGEPWPIPAVGAEP